MHGFSRNLAEQTGVTWLCHANVILTLSRAENRVGTCANSADLVQTPQNAAFGRGQHCFLP